MDILLQQIFNGLTLGSIYALVALGYTMVYGILGLINFAHGEVVMIGALTALAVMKPLAAAGVPGPLAVLLALLAAALVCMALGFTIERVAYRRLRNAPRLAPLITAIGVSIVLQQVAMLVWGRNYHSVPALLPSANHEVLGAQITEVQILIIVVAALTMSGLMLLVNRTRMGRAMRATAENPTVAALMGVDANRIIALTFVIGSALAALAGVLVSANYGIAHYTWVSSSASRPSPRRSSAASATWPEPWWGASFWASSRLSEPATSATSPEAFSAPTTRTSSPSSSSSWYSSSDRRA